MGQQKLYFCTVVFWNAESEKFFNFVSTAIAECEELAHRRALRLAENYSRDKEKWTAIGVTVWPVKREVIEQAAVEVLGWNRPEDGLTVKHSEKVITEMALANV